MESSAEKAFFLQIFLQAQLVFKFYWTKEDKFQVLEHIKATDSTVKILDIFSQKK